MKKVLSSFIFACAFILVISLNAFCEEIELKLLNLDKGNIFDIATSAPVHCYWFYIENPSSLVVDFFEDDILGAFDEEIILKEGAVESVKSYFTEDKKIDFLLFKFRHTPLISAAADDAALTIMVNGVFLKSAENPGQRQAKIEAALFAAKEKIISEIFAPAMPLQNPVVDTNIVLFTEARKPLLLLVEAPQRISARALTLKKKHVGNSAEKEKNTEDSASLVRTVEKTENEAEIPFGERLFIEKDAQDNGGSDYASNAVIPSMVTDSSVDFSGQYGFLTVVIYLFGSISMVGVVAVCYKVSGRGTDLGVYDKHPRLPLRKNSIFDKYENRRRTPRVKISNFDLRRQMELEIETLSEDKPKHRGKLINLSLSGACFELPSEVEVPLVAQVDMFLPDGQLIEACARLIWQGYLQEKKKVYGASFLAMDQVNRDDLNLYLNKNLNGYG